MTEHAPSTSTAFDDSTTSHPLDILINAISGSTDYTLPHGSGSDGFRDGQELDMEGLLEDAEEVEIVQVSLGDERSLQSAGEEQ